MADAVGRKRACQDAKMMDAVKRKRENQDAKMTDAVKGKKENQGKHECEVLGDGPIDLEGSFAWNNCKKPAGHQSYIPVAQFCLDDVGSQSVFDLIQNYIARTVHIKVGYTSWGRPSNYIFSSFKGQHLPSHHGTGWLYNVEKGDGCCPCKECSGVLASQSPWWSVELYTACHVLYDTDEVKHTKVNFFYDEKNVDVTTLHGAEVISKSPLSDWCKFRCAIHDANLAKKLKGLLNANQEVWIMKPQSSVRGKRCVVVSHPHGMPKKISVGEVLATRRKGGSDLMFNYTTATCSGSSGAPVLVIQDDIGPGVEYSTWCHWIAPHSGSSGSGSKEDYNSSCGAIELRT